MRVVFRVDASLEIGVGHVMRCLTLAKLLQSKGVKVEFISREHEGNLITHILSEGFYVFKLDRNLTKNFDKKLKHSHWLGITQENDALECLSFLNREPVDWLIVDHYAIDRDWHKILSESYNKLLVIDDLADREHLCDILVDQTHGRLKEDYHELVSENCEILCGSRFALLRPEFMKWRKYSLKRRKSYDVKQILINFGGIDAENNTELILEELRHCNLSDQLRIIVVMGFSSMHLESVRRVANSLPHNIDLRTQVDNMAEIMANSDISIGASGTTSWERCCLGLPSIQIIVSENQRLLADHLASKKIIKLLKDFKDLRLLLNSAQNWIQSYSYNSSKICDGMGAYFISEKIVHKLINLKGIGELTLQNYTSLSGEDTVKVLAMRNHNNVKKFMHTKEEISHKSHLEFINELKEKSDKLYFLVRHGKKIVGSINLYKDVSDNSVEFGLYANPLEKTHGVGKMLLDVISLYSSSELEVKRIKLEVLSENKHAINFYTNYGFQSNKKIQKNSQKVICMSKTIF